MLHQVRNKPSRAGARKRAAVGYRKPPKRTQFKPGQSGNPNGRPKGVRNFETDLDETLRELVDVNKGGVFRRVTNQKAMLSNLLQKALDGDLRASDQLIKAILRCRDKPGEVAAAMVLEDNDRAILDDYYNERRAREGDNAGSGLSDPIGPTPAARSDREA
jgi:uncharacterized protein DUF5681